MRCIFLLERLVQVHYISHHFRMESYGISHLLLKFKVQIVEDIFCYPSIIGVGLNKIFWGWTRGVLAV